MVATNTIARFILSTLLSFWMRQWRMINHISQTLGNQSEVPPRRLITPRAGATCCEKRREILASGYSGWVRSTSTLVLLHSCAIATGRSDADATELAGLCSGHSLRAGYCTASAMAGVPEWKARRRSRHRSAETFAGYVRAAEEWTDSGLKGVGF